MTKDYAKPSSTRKVAASKRKKKAPSGASRSTPPPTTNTNKLKFILLIALLLGGFVYALYSLQNIPAKQQPVESQKTQQSVKESRQKILENTTKQTEKQEARFKFYDLLPKSEVDTNNINAYQFKEKNTGESFYYVVQTGSFRSADDADQQKATIAFQGLKAKIKPVKSSTGKTWYRVEAGPFNSRSEMNSALDKLVAINIEPLVKKVKNR
jgi:cell division protein FtsN